jgi:hypothetical protein
MTNNVEIFLQNNIFFNLFNNISLQSSPLSKIHTKIKWYNFYISEHYRNSIHMTIVLTDLA